MIPDGYRRYADAIITMQKPGISTYTIIMKIILENWLNHAPVKVCVNTAPRIVPDKLAHTFIRIPKHVCNGGFQIINVIDFNYTDRMFVFGKKMMFIVFVPMFKRAASFY